jgi:UDP-GlcNAc:undecaprenyl-phosphate GlcNAc-1-phosphate transferase
LRVFVFIFLIALALTAASMPFVRRFAIWVGFVDMPAARKLHRTPMPLLGGLAIAVCVIFAFLLLARTVDISIMAPQVVGTLAASAIVAFVGLVDDRRHLPAWVKLLGQVIGFLILAYVGVRVSLDIPEWMNYALTLMWLVGISNAINFLDNMDGLSAGVSAVAAAFILLLATLTEQYLVAALAAAILGACLGFLRYNFKPARIFMGDAGALFLGFLLAVLCIQLRFPENVSFVTWMVPIFVMGLPIFDMTLVVISRMRRNVNPFTTAGKDHVSHRLVEGGNSEREAVLILYLVSGIFGMGALFIMSADVLEGYVLGLATAIVCLIGIWRLERQSDRLSKAAKNKPEGAIAQSQGIEGID